MSENKGYVTVNVTTIIKQLTEEDKQQIGKETVEAILKILAEKEKLEQEAKNAGAY